MRTFADGTEEKNALDSVKSFVTKRLPPKALQFVKGLTWSKTSMTALVVGFVLGDADDEAIDRLRGLADRVARRGR